jgi:hypothetical protein
MTGKLSKSTEGWNVIYVKDQHTNVNYPLHPDDIDETLEENKEVEFQRTKKYLSNETIVYAKIVKKKNKYNLNPNEWILIKHQTIEELISDAKQKDVPTEIIEAIFKWIKSNNTLNKD